MPKKTYSNHKNPSRKQKKHTPVIFGVILAVLIGIQSVTRSPLLDQLIPVMEQLTGDALQGYLEEGNDGAKTAGTIKGQEKAGNAGTNKDDGQIGNGGESGQPGGIEAWISTENIPEYSGEPAISVNGNQPLFTEEEITAASFEYYSPLDELGRCGVAIASVGQDLMPTEKRGSISSVKPTGWQTAKYDIVDGNQLYNRCHLIGFQLTGENANEKNLITGTRYLNVDGMLPFENLVAEYVKETGNHVMYRVTPVFDGANLVADGLYMEGKSVEDKGEGVRFFVYVYNVQPGIGIDYETGESWLVTNTPKEGRE